MIRSLLAGPLARYLRRTLAVQTAGVLVALTAVLQILELLDVTTDILRRHLGFAGVLHYAALRTASEFALALPLAMLIGSLFTFYTLARNHELIAIRAAGIRLRSMLVAMLPVVLGFALLQFVVADRIVPVAEAALSDWWQASALPDTDHEDDTKALAWFRTADGLVSVAQTSTDGHHLSGVTVYRRDAQGFYRGRITADRADWIGGRWQLASMISLTLAGGGVQRDQQAVADWQTNLLPSDLRRLDSRSLPLSSSTLIDVITGARVGDRPLSFYRTALYKSYFAPLSMMVMLLLALPATRAVQRGGGGGGALLQALASGLGLVLLTGLLGSLGQGGRLPPMLAALLPVIIFGSLGLGWLRQYDREG